MGVTQQIDFAELLFFTLYDMMLQADVGKLLEKRHGIPVF
jgi:hypothetical protein